VWPNQTLKTACEGYFTNTRQKKQQVMKSLWWMKAVVDESDVGLKCNS
jgi:hypothetical protein